MIGTIVTVVATLMVALHLAAVIDVALMPAWAWRGAADARKRRWIVELLLIPGWAIVYYRSADRREVRAHLFRCGGVEPDWHARHAPDPRPPSLIDGAVATMKDRKLLREVLDPPPGTDLVPIRWEAASARVAPPAIPAPPVPAALAAGAPPAPRPDSAPRPRELLPPIRWYAADHEPRALPAARHRLRLTA